MNHWLILILTAVAMVAIVLAFAWWWTTENWDWASAELKPPRTVSQKPPVNHLTEWMRIQEDYNKLMHQRVTNAWGALENLDRRVTALEEKMPEDMNLHLDQLFSRLQIMERKLDGYLEDSPSPPTASPTTDSPSDAAEQESIPPESLASSRSDQRIIVGGRVGRALKSADPPDAST